MTALTQEDNKINEDIKVTDSAVNKVYELMDGEGNLDLKLRVYITGGGCSGFQYGFSFEEEVNPDDFIFDKYLSKEAKDPIPHIQILIDAMSMQYLKGAEIDYKKDINGERFIIRGNPNAKTTCGCGSSFSADA